jgi:D-amino-acid dehydrogenase
MERPDHSCKIPCIFYERNMVATPWKTGYRLGGTMELSGLNGDLNAKRLSRLIAGAAEYLRPSTEQPALEQWAGFRPMTYDDLPVIGFSPSHENLVIATGHGMLGLSMSAGTGSAVCDLINGQKPSFDLTPFSVDRF